MKKFIAGILVGLLIAAAGTAFADGINMIGKQIDGQFPVSVDGEYLETPAIVVDGQSFLPVRSFGETVGYAVYFDAKGEVKLQPDLSRIEVIHGFHPRAKAEEEAMSEQIRVKNEKFKQIADLEIAIHLATLEIEQAQEKIDKYEKYQTLEVDVHGVRDAKLDQDIAVQQSIVNQKQAALTELQAQLAAIEQPEPTPTPAE